MDTTKVQPDKPISFVEAHLQEYGQGVVYTAQPTGSSAGWRVPVAFPGSSVALTLFQSAWLLSASSRQLVGS